MRWPTFMLGVSMANFVWSCLDRFEAGAFVSGWSIFALVVVMNWPRKKGGAS